MTASRVRCAVLAIALGVPLSLAPPASAAPGDPVGTLSTSSATFSDAVLSTTSPSPVPPRYCGGDGQPSCLSVGAGAPASQVRWGRSVDGSPSWTAQSGLGFAAAAPVVAHEGEDVVLGDLLHFNQPVIGTVEQVELAVGARLTTPSGDVLDVPVPITFLVDETPNQSPCEYPSTSPCADAISIAGGSADGSVISGVTRYQVEVLGFQTGGAPVSRFVSQEGTTNNAAALVARVTPSSALEADAGADQTVEERELVTLSGATAPPAADRTWTQTGGPAVALSDPASASPTFIAPDVVADTVLRFQLAASGSPWEPATDEVLVTVQHVNRAPVADAGADRPVEQSRPDGALVTLDGSGSSDPDGDPLSHTWTGPFGTVSGAQPEVLLPPGVSTVELVVSDGAASSSDSVVIVVEDTLAPTITASRSPEADADGWVGEQVTVTFSCTDGGSGVASCPAPVLLGEGEDQSASGTATDAAGNSASTTLADIDVDLTAPVVAFSGARPSYDADDRIVVSCSASDALSGLATSSCPQVDEPAWSYAGTTTLTAAATDRGENTASDQVSFTVAVTTEGLCRLVASLSDSEGVAGSLCAKLRTAQASEDRGQEDTAERQRQAFRNEVAAQSGKAFTEHEAARLVELSRQL